MGLFGPPDVTKLQEKRKISKLIRLLRLPAASDLHCRASDALIAIGNDALGPLIQALQFQIQSDHRLNKFFLSCEFKAALFKALLFIDVESAESALTQAWRTPDFNETLDMIVTMLKKEPPERSVPILLKALTSENSSLRWIAALALARLRDKRAVEPLVNLVIEGGSMAQKVLLELIHIGDIRTFSLPSKTLELLEREELKALESGIEGRLEKSWSVKRISSKWGVPELDVGDVVRIMRIPGWWQKVISLKSGPVVLQDLKTGKIEQRSIQDFKDAWKHLNPHLVESVGEELFAARQKALKELSARYEALDFAHMDLDSMVSWLRQEIKWLNENDSADFELEEESLIRKTAIQRLGQELNRRGGMELMLQIHRRAYRNRLVELLWDMIGDWRG